MGMRMNRSVFRLLVGSFLLGTAACDTTNDAATDSAVNYIVEEPLISDAAHQPGVKGFRFLPPMVPPPAVEGDIVPGLPVSVRVDELTTTGSVSHTVSTFTPTDGPNGERVRTHLKNLWSASDDDGDADPTGYYYVRWFANDEQLSPSARYRVRVLVPAKDGHHRELGFADIDVVRTAREFRRVDTQRYTPLIGGTTLRIKFRVDRQAVDRDGDGVYDWLDNCPSVANAEQLDSLTNGTGDACRCLHTSCSASDTCHAAGQCDPATGQCVNTAVPDGRPCRMAHADATCIGGKCQLSHCVAQYSDCNGDPSDGCETSLSSNENCGACGQRCPGSPNGVAICRSGECLLRCGNGRDDCDRDPATGCETDTRRDPANCGTCGRRCPNQASCIRGGCTATSCKEGWADCDGAVITGCETNVSEDAQHCGACENTCAPANGLGSCNAGTCVVAACLPGFADCDVQSDNGCEAALGIDVANCGACGAACSVVHGSPQCVDGACSLAACDAGYADCNGALSDGCETMLGSDPLNCGACGNVCANGACNGGQCCPTGQTLCNGLCTTVASDTANCGTCDHRCSTGETCLVGQCATLNVVSGPLAAGGGSACALLADCTVECWGYNGSGQLGNGTTINSSTPVLVSGLSGATGLFGGGGHACALLANGTAVCWGENSYGQLGNGTTVNSPTPVAVAGLTGIVAMGVSGRHTCALLMDGNVVCWGRSDGLGNGGSTNASTPVAVVGLSNVTTLAAGAATCAVRADGTVYCWGMNFAGQLGNGTTKDSLTPVAVSGLSDVQAIAAGLSHGCAVLNGGAVACWGRNYSGQLGNGTTTDSLVPVIVSGITNARAISVGAMHSCALLTDGTVKCWGGGYKGQLGNGIASSTTPVEVRGLTQATAISAGETHTCAMLEGGTVKCWGENVNGELGNGTLNNAFLPTTVALRGEASADGVCGVGVAQCNVGQSVCNGACVSLDSDPVNCGNCGHACGGGLCAAGQCCQDGIVCNGKCAWPTIESANCGACGNNCPNGYRCSVGQCVPLQATIVAGHSHTCELQTTGTVKCWGSNSTGQLGNGTFSNSSVAVVVSGVSGATSIAAGGAHTCVTLWNGTVECWGGNSAGALGNGTTVASPTAVAVVGLTGVSSVAAGAGHTCALLASGTVECWGDNFYQQLGYGYESVFHSTTPAPVLDGVQALAAGGNHTCVFKGGTADCWGQNQFGELGNGRAGGSSGSSPVLGLTDVFAIAPSTEHMCALLRSGMVECWGANFNGQIGSGTTSSWTHVPMIVPGVSGVTSIALGGSHTCALLTGGTVECWGRGREGALGGGTWTDGPTLVPVSGLTAAKVITAGNNHTCALLANDSVECWGDNESGQLGNEIGTSSSRPVPVSGLSCEGQYCCSGGQSYCETTCTSLSTDSANCGACGNQCAGTACLEGQCICSVGQKLCSGACSWPLSDSANCGACGNQCPNDTACSAGQCCPTGQTACDRHCTSLADDPANCGACGNTCSSGRCVGGQCCSNSNGPCCIGALALCNGSCTSPNTDPLNCGACGNVCDSATQECVWGSCVPRCTGGPRCGMGECCAPPGYCTAGVCFAGS